MATLVIATRNPHKVEEIKAILGRAWHYLALNDFPGAPEVVEDAATFAGNATKKSVQLAKWFSDRLPPGSDRQQRPDAGGVAAWVLADDSGLEVDALNGAPGVHSARFAALDTDNPSNSPALANNAKLLKLLQDVPLAKRTARFRCVIAVTPVLAPGKALASPACGIDEHELQTDLFQGVCEGHIEFGLKGSGGFGYDPLFIPRGYTQTFAELPEATKNRLSHRAKALSELRKRLSDRV
jgi:XTP/dITP diphosphohydrolase